MSVLQCMRECESTHQNMTWQSNLKTLCLCCYCCCRLLLSPRSYTFTVCSRVRVSSIHIASFHLIFSVFVANTYADAELPPSSSSHISTFFDGIQTNEQPTRKLHKRASQRNIISISIGISVVIFNSITVAVVVCVFVCTMEMCL